MQFIIKYGFFCINILCPVYQEKTTDLPQVTNNLLSHNVVSSTSPHETEWDLNSQL
jgi:hypothetical protein